MHCDDARLDLALWVGNDLDDRARIEELRRHIATCPHCRARAKALQASMVALGSPDPDPTFDRIESLWPELESRIDYLETAPKSRPLWGASGLAVLAGVAACVSVWFWATRSSDPTPAPTSTPVTTPAPTVPPVPHRSPGESPGSIVHPVHPGR